MSSLHSFPHEKLIAWQIARQARTAALAFTATVPRGHGDECRQINNAAASVVCEGAGRWQPGDKIHKFQIAQGEGSEAAGAVVSLLDAGLGNDVLGAEFLRLEARACALVTGLIKAQRRRV